jgi:hypothetical protein
MPAMARIELSASAVLTDKDENTLNQRPVQSAHIHARLGRRVEGDVPGET